MTSENKIIMWAAGVIVLLVIGFGINAALHPEMSVFSNQNPDSTSTSTLPGLQTGNAPWIAEIDHLKDRLTAIGLPALSEEGTVLHTHQHLDIFVHGSFVQIPAGIGIDELAGFISPIHVHDETGIIHVESPTVQTFTLGQFFDIWGVRFDQNSIGGYVADGSSTLSVYVNGKKVDGNPRSIELTAHEEIAIVFGLQSEQPSVPASYSFPEGL